MKTIKRALAILLAVAMMVIANVVPVSAAPSFTDVKTTAWYYNYVNKLVDLKITAGIGNNKYGPDNSVTRAEFVTFLCKATGLSQEEGYAYNDTKDHWSSKWISAAVEANIIDKGTAFNPNKAITRQEAVEMLCRSLGLQQDTTMTTPYADITSEQGYSNTAYKEYLIVGSVSKDKRYFYPGSSLTRAETAAVIVNLVDYKADTNSYKAKKKSEMDSQKAETQTYEAWKDSVKDISPILLSNTDGLIKESVYDSYKYLRNEEKKCFVNWGDQYGMTPEEFEQEMVKVGTKYGNTWANVDYRKLDELETNLKSLWEKNIINNYLKRNLDRVKNRKVVSEGKFITSTGMLVFADWGNPVLRGTLRYKYSAPTTKEALNSEIVGSTGKASQINTWYEQDFEITFLPQSDGLKITGMDAISDIRISK